MNTHPTAQRLERWLLSALEAGACIDEVWRSGGGVVRVDGTRRTATASYGPCWTSGNVREHAARLANRRWAGWTRLRIVRRPIYGARHIAAPDNVSAKDLEEMVWVEFSDADLMEAAQQIRSGRSHSPWDASLASVDDVSLPDVSGPHENLADSYPVIRLSDLVALPTTEA